MSDRLVSNGDDNDYDGGGDDDDHCADGHNDIGNIFWWFLNTQNSRCALLWLFSWPPPPPFPEGLFEHLQNKKRKSFSFIDEIFSGMWEFRF